MEHIRGNINGLALNLVGPAGIIPDTPDDSANVSLRHGDGLAIVERLNSGKEIDVLLAEISQLVHQNATLRRSGGLPRPAEGLAGGSNCEVDILFCGLAHGADDLFGCGVDDLERLLLDTFYELIVDEEPGGLLESAGDGRLELNVKVGHDELVGETRRRDM